VRECGAYADLYLLNPKLPVSTHLWRGDAMFGEIAAQRFLQSFLAPLVAER